MATYKDKKTGEWYTQFRVRKPDGKLALTKKRGFKSRDAALQYELTHKHESTASESTTFLQMFEYMTIACRASETTTQQRRTRLKKYCKQLINRPMKSLTKADFIAWRDTLPSFGLSTQTQNDVVNLIKQIGRHGWEAYDIPDCTKVLKPFKKPLEEYKEMTILTPQQFQALLDAEENDLLRTFFQFLYMCGCRKGEARCLLKADSNPQTKTVYIGKSGLTDTVIKEMDDYLSVHEMVKVKIQEGSILDAKPTANALAEMLNADFVQAIGRKFVLYRPAPEKENRKIVLPR